VSSRLTSPSSVSMSSSSASLRCVPQSSLSGDGAKSVPLMEHLRRVRRGSGRQLTTDQVANNVVLPLVGNVGLKDLLLSNDDDEVSHVNCEQMAVSVADTAAGDDTAKMPDSSTTKHSKPAVLLMSLLSRPDDDVDDDDVTGDVNDTNGLRNHSHTGPHGADDAGVQGLSVDGHSEQPLRNHLLRV